MTRVARDQEEECLTVMGVVPRWESVMGASVSMARFVRAARSTGTRLRSPNYAGLKAPDRGAGASYRPTYSGDYRRLYAGGLSRSRSKIAVVSLDGLA